MPVGVPVQRRRNPKFMKEKSNDTLTPAQEKEHMNRQTAAYERHVAQQKEDAQLHASLRVNTELTEEGKAGKVPTEPHLPKKTVANERGEKERKDGVKNVETVPIKTGGKTTGEAVVDPPAAQNAPETPPQPNDKLHDAVAGSRKGGRKRGGKK